MIRSWFRGLRAAPILAAVLATTLWQPGSASAATGTFVEMQEVDPALPNVFDFALTAAAGKVNNVTVTQTVTTTGTEVFLIVDTGDVITTGAGCGRDPANPLDAHRARCGANTVLEAFIDLGDQNDTLTYAGGNVRARLDGQDGNDQLTATSGTDLDFFGGAGDDDLIGGPGDDALIGGPGNDTLNGNGGDDTAVYTDHTAAVHVSLNGIADDGSGTETDNANTENITGGNGADTLTGNAGANALRGFAGNDTLDGGPGPDLLDGGTGVDTADYSSRSAAVVVTLAGGANDGEPSPVAENDNVVGTENVRGGAGDDVLIGDGANNVLAGNNGDDTLSGNAGADTLLGGLGFDFLDGGSNPTLQFDVCNLGGTGPDGGVTQNCP